MSNQEYAVEAPELAGQITVRPPTLFGTAQLLVNGSPARPGPRRNTFLLEGRDGRDRVATWAPDFLAVVPRLVVEGQTYSVGPKIPVFLLVLGALPFGLVPVGGLLGGLFGGLAFGLNQQIARSTLSVPLRALAILAVGATAVVAFLIAAMAATVALGG